MIYKGVKIPKLNGRPQVWLRGDWCFPWRTIRIIYPDGIVEFCEEPVDNLNRHLYYFRLGCTGAVNQLDAIKKTIRFDASNYGTPIFVGYA